PPPSFKTEFEALRQRLDGYSKSLEQLFGKGRKIKYIFATRNLRLSREGADIQRLLDTNSFFYNDNTFDYVNGLIRAYKEAAHYQFLGMLFKGQTINKDPIEVPALEGKMGNKKYYMFSLEPKLLLKMGFVLHRTRANEAEMPTYQRLLVPSRLTGIGKFIDGGGFFPNSIVLNFNEQGNQIRFEGQPRTKDSRSRSGTLKIPNCYAIAYIIDGQHRVYGYARSGYKDTNTIPVVAFVGLESTEQLEMFMDINQNQKAVSPTLRITLEEDLYWNSPRLDSRMKALRSSIIRKLGGDATGPLFGMISLGEDKADLTAKPFADSLLRSGLLPEATRTKFKEGTGRTSLYNTNNHEHIKEMESTRRRVVDFVNQCYQFAETNCSDKHDLLRTYILSNRGTYAFISLLGSLNTYETGKGNVAVGTTTEERFSVVEKYLHALFVALEDIAPELEQLLTGKLGSGAETTWFRSFQGLVNERFADYEPPGLTDWRERQDKAIQNEGREVGTAIERHMKGFIIKTLKALFDENWDIEIGAIKRQCQNRAEEQMEKNYKEDLGRHEIPWTDQFGLSDYKSIIEKYWGKAPEDAADDYQTLERHFSIDIGHGFNSKAERLRWLSKFISLRNLWAHEGTKEKGLNREEVEFLKRIHENLGLE
ncbi:MAG: DGQHR domain-containing protein, partial [Robiginitomaculum sp.]|nr:DGQHR domain-containing protein [Robiginitomaculum sp.]